MIRKAEITDLSRIAEIFVFNNRVNYYPIFNDPDYSFSQLTVENIIDEYFSHEEHLANIYVYDDNSIVKGFIEIDKKQVKKLYVDTFFQSQGIGSHLMEFATDLFECNHLWALEKNTRARVFYNRHGFYETGEKEFEEGTTEYLVHLKRG